MGKNRFAGVAATLRDFGLDLARDRLPVAPAAHYCMGGVRTDTWGRTDVPGLYAAGEVACSGVQGANRLASHSLLECLVFGARAAEAALADSASRFARWRTSRLPKHDQTLAAPHTVIQAMDTAVLCDRLHADLGVERTATRLEPLTAEIPN